MKYRLIFIALVVAFPACNKPAARNEPAEPVNQLVSSQTENRQPLDFDQLLLEIKNCNEKDLAYFHQHWDKIHTNLKLAVENRELIGLQMTQQEELWDALSYLQGCRHGDIMREHGADMVKILSCFGTEEQLALLNDIFPNGAKDAR